MSLIATLCKRQALSLQVRPLYLYIKREFCTRRVTENDKSHNELDLGSKYLFFGLSMAQMPPQESLYATEIWTVLETFCDFWVSSLFLEC